MASFNQISNGYKIYTQQRLDRLESEVTNLTSDSDIDNLEASLAERVNDAKKDINNRIDEVQDEVTSWRPHPSDPDYSTKKAQYAQLLRESISGMDLLKNWFQKIFNHVKQIITSVVRWIVDKVVGVARRIKDAFSSLFRFFF
jgi:hypothetical protein